MDTSRKLKVIVLTQDDPFYLGSYLDVLLSLISINHECVGVVSLPQSVNGKTQTLLEKVKDAFTVFGLNFLVYYGLKALKNKITRKHRIDYVVHTHGLKLCNLTGNINDQINADKLKGFNADLMISFASNKVLKQNILDLFTLGVINLHTALLPKYRGLMPSFWVLKNGEKITGVSVFFVDEGIDSGPIILQKAYPITEKNQSKVIQDTKLLGVYALSEAVDLISRGDLTLIQNNDEQASYFGFPSRQDVLDFKKSGARFF